MTYVKAFFIGIVVTVLILIGGRVAGYDGQKVLGMAIIIGLILAVSLSGILSGEDRQRPWGQWTARDMAETTNQGLLIFVCTLPAMLGFFLNYVYLMN